MHPDFLSLYSRGISGELALLPPAGKVEYFHNAVKSTVFDEAMAFPFVNALFNLDETSQTAQTGQVLRYVLARASEAAPLHGQLMKLRTMLEPSAEREKQAKALEHLQFDEKSETRLRKKLSMTSPAAQADLERELVAELKNNPMHIGAAQLCLELDERLDRLPSTWLSAFTCPPLLAGPWYKALFQHLARRGLASAALEVWTRWRPLCEDAYALVLAADMYALDGNREEAITLYQQAVARDPLLEPVRFRIAELTNPQPVKPALVSERTTMICLYSWNKAELLAQTLRSLAASGISNNPIRVLLNGCTDDSAQRVHALRELFPNNDFDVCELPINIGAPAARNWLLALPETKACDFVAFLDDDIDVPADWLEQYLSILDANPRAGVVGAKIIHPPGQHSSGYLQYTHRYVSLAEHGILKLSVSAPPATRDTGLYAYARRCLNVMGCLHLFRAQMLDEVGGFDLRFSPSQIDDIEHDLAAVLRGWEVWYCGTVTCVHHQKSGLGSQSSQGKAAFGSIAGNDLKMSFKHEANFAQLKALSREALDAPPPVSQ